MNDDPLEILSSLIDGEVVDAALLVRALEAPGAHEALLDFARIRERIAQEPVAAPESLRLALENELRSSGSSGRRLILVGVAAALPLLIAAGLLLRSHSPDRSVAVPPPATREVSFTDGVDWFRKSS